MHRYVFDLSSLIKVKLFCLTIFTKKLYKSCCRARCYTERITLKDLSNDSAKVKVGSQSNNH